MTGDELARLLADARVELLDVRSHAEFTGAAGYPCDPRQGHIPGAVQLDVLELFTGEGLPHDAETIRRLLSDRGIDPDRDIVAYCHSGQRSAVVAAALRSAGLAAENYEGSWHEWSRRDTS